MFRDVDAVEPAEKQCAVGERQDCPCPDGTTGWQECVDERRYGKCHCGMSDIGPEADAVGGADGDTGPVAGDTGSMPELDGGGMPGDGIDAPDGTDEDAEGDTSTPPSCSTGHSTYSVARVDAGPTIDGACDDAVYEQASVMAFSPAESPEADPGNGTDNTGTCRLVWESGASPRIHGCCEIEDDEPVGETSPGDPYYHIWGEEGESDGSIPPDDRVEQRMRCDQMQTGGEKAAKFYLNNREDPGPAAYAQRLIEPQEQAFMYDGIVEADASRETGGWTVEWTAKPPCELSSDDVGLCDVSVYDVDADKSHGGHMNGLAPLIRDQNDPANWGCCHYE